MREKQFNKLHNLRFSLAKNVGYLRHRSTCEFHELFYNPMKVV